MWYRWRECFFEWLGQLRTTISVHTPSLNRSDLRWPSTSSVQHLLVRSTLTILFTTTMKTSGLFRTGEPFVHKKVWIKKKVRVGLKSKKHSREKRDFIRDFISPSFFRKEQEIVVKILFLYFLLPTTKLLSQRWTSTRTKLEGSLHRTFRLGPDPDPVPRAPWPSLVGEVTPWGSWSEEWDQDRDVPWNPLGRGPGWRRRHTGVVEQ